MSSIPELSNIVEYELSHEVYGTLEIEEPVGWSEDLVNIKRSTKNFSVITVYNLNFEFMLSGANFIRNVYKEFGLQAQIVLKKRAIHPTKQEVMEVYTSILDGYSFELEGQKVKVNTLESEIVAQIKGYESEKVELNRSESISGVDIGSFGTRNTIIDGKQILLVSKWETNGEDQAINHLGSNNYESIALMLDAPGLSDDQAGDVVEQSISDGGQGFPNDGSVAGSFYSIADKDTKVVLEIDVSLTMDAVQNDNITHINNGMSSMSGRLYLYVYEDKSSIGQSQHEFKRKELLQNATTGNDYQTVDFYQREERTILKGESYQLAYRSVSFGDANNLRLHKNKSNMVLTEDSFHDPSTTKTILPFELFERLLKIMTGNTNSVLVSDYFGRTDLGYAKDGDGAYMGITSGFYVRGFSAEEKPLATSWKKALKSYGVVADGGGITYAIEKRGFQEFVRIEPLSYFFTDNTLVMDRVVSSKDIKVTVRKANSYKSIEIGSLQGGDNYEEAVGLDEPNGKMNWLTPLSRAENGFIKLSEYRLDGTAMEFARRKPQLTFPTEDTDYDNDIMMMDLKKDPSSDSLLQRKWADDYSTMPRGVYSPETLTNIRWSPRELFRNHEWFIKSCLVQYPNEYIRFGSGIGNTLLKLEGVVSKDDILINDMDRHKFQNIDISFPYRTDYVLEQKILDNIYGIFEIRDERGLVYKFRLFDFKDGKYKGVLIDGIQ